MAIIVGLLALCGLMNLAGGGSGGQAVVAGSGSGPAPAAYYDKDGDSYTHTNEKGHVHTRTEWVDGYYRSDGTYVSGHYRRTE